MPSVIGQSEPYREALVERLIERGAITSPQWRAAFSAVRREIFVPRFDYREHDGSLVLYDIAEQGLSADFLTAVYSDAPLVTQRNAAGVAISSSSQPSLMAIMLERLDIQGGQSVLEVGTGTGYNAALLSHRLGDAAVTTIDINSQATAAARHHLSQAGYKPFVATGDGSIFVSERGPFDRVIATCNVSRIPSTWIRHTRSSGKILTSISSGLVVLTVNGDGSAAGQFDSQPAGFMGLRHDADGNSAHEQSEMYASVLNREGYSHKTVVPHDLQDSSIEFLSELIMPGVQATVFNDSFNDSAIYLFVDPVSGSWARISGEIGNGATVTEHGCRALWDEKLAIIDEWKLLGKPPVSSYALTVEPDGTHYLTHPLTGWSRVL